MARVGSRSARRWIAPALAGLLLATAGAPRAEEETSGEPTPAAEPAPSAAAKPASNAAKSAGGGAALLREASELRRRANERGIETQKRIDALSDKTDERYARYTAALNQLASLRTYNERMRELVATQESELGGLRGQLEQVEAVGRSVTPLMLRMIESLEEFVELDVPFLIEERHDRIAQLRRLMIRADVSVSEKYRRIMEAYQIESEYGRTIEAYRGSLEGAATVDPELESEDVDFLRFGRIALMYLTLDGEKVGAWDAAAREWKALDASYAAEVRDGIRIARKQIPPDLIALPLPVPDAPGGES